MKFPADQLDQVFDLVVADFPFEGGHSVLGKAFFDGFDEFRVGFFFQFVGGEIRGFDLFAVDLGFAAGAVFLMAADAPVEKDLFCRRELVRRGGRRRRGIRRGIRRRIGTGGAIG